MVQTYRLKDRECDQVRAELSEPSLPLPDPFPEYVVCPHCGEPEVEVWCYQARVPCHACGEWIAHQPPPCCGCSVKCRAEKRETL